MPVWKVASLSLVFGIVWFFANYLYALALVSKSVALVNTLSSMSSVFVMIMAAVPLLPREPGDKITLSRVLVSLLRYVLYASSPLMISIVTHTIVAFKTKVHNNYVYHISP
ncbi:Solute carrier family 35 member F5, partial [Geodia barretti]